MALMYHGKKYAFDSAKRNLKAAKKRSKQLKEKGYCTVITDATVVFTVFKRKCKKTR